MLYHLHETQHAAAQPLRLAAQSGQLFFRNPLNPLSHSAFGRSMAAACEIVDYTLKRRERPDFGFESIEIDGRQVAVSEDVILDLPFCHLKHFRRDSGRDDPRVLVVAPLSGHYATLLRGTVAALLPNHDVYITDWLDARDVPVSEGGFDLDDYVEDVRGILGHLGSGTHVMAVCQPSVPVLAAVSLMSADNDPATPKSMILMGGPIDTRVNPTAINRVAESRPIEWFERSVIARVPLPYAGVMRRVYPGFIQLTGFMTMNMERHLNAHLKLYDHLIEGDGDSAAAHRKFYDEYLAVMDLPAEFYLQTVKTVFQEHALPKGEMTVRGAPVDPSAITRTALMTIEGELDDISGLGQTRAAHDLCTGIPRAARVHRQQSQAGHYGIFNGRRWRNKICPAVAEFIRAHA